MQTIEKYKFKSVQKVFDFVDAYQVERQVPNVISSPPRPFGPLQIFIQGTEKELVLRKNSSGYLLFFGDILFPNGIMYQQLYKAKQLLTIKTAFYQDEIIEVDLWSPENDVPKLFQQALSPNYAYPFPKIPFEKGDTFLRGQVEDDFGDKVAGVKITAVIQTQTLTYSQTDQTGQFIFLSPQDLQTGEEINVEFTMQKENRPLKSEQQIVIEKGKSISLDKLIWTED